ncbi:MAG: GNAT family N-acetyltransferase [Deltaproteobacteria bacterium]|nr:GNAT family N-acetyltransferase [Deltaproteobacteria bacterium]
MDYRPLQPRDVPLLREFLYQAVHVPAGQAPYPREIVDLPAIRVYAEDWGAPDDAGFVADADGTVVGMIWIRLLKGDRRGFGYLDDSTPELAMSVLPDHRAQGIGTCLMAAMLGFAAPRYPALSLSVDLDNPAKHLYDRLGFLEVARSGGSVTMRLGFASVPRRTSG